MDVVTHPELWRPDGFKPVQYDPRRLLAERAAGDDRFLSVVEFLDRARLAEAQGEQFLNADGIYYHDTRQPFVVAGQSPITLAATDKLLYPGSLTALIANYFTIGKKLRLTVHGTITTAATPGNLGVEIYYGTTDAGGTLLASSAALTLIANQATIPFIVTVNCHCRATGPTGSLYVWAKLEIGPAVFAVGQALIPASAPAAVTVDTTAAAGLNVQFKRSGSTAEAATTQDLIFEALN